MSVDELSIQIIIVNMANNTIFVYFHQIFGVSLHLLTHWHMFWLSIEAKPCISFPLLTTFPGRAWVKGLSLQWESARPHRYFIHCLSVCLLRQAAWVTSASGGRCLTNGCCDFAANTNDPYRWPRNVSDSNLTGDTTEEQEHYERCLYTERLNTNSKSGVKEDFFTTTTFLRYRKDALHTQHVVKT